jgi:hypothetical protein
LINYNKFHALILPSFDWKERSEAGRIKIFTSEGSVENPNYKKVFDKTVSSIQIEPIEIGIDLKKKTLLKFEYSFINPGFGICDPKVILSQKK